MDDKVEELRRLAREAMARARTATIVGERSAWLAIADSWENLANERYAFLLAKGARASDRCGQE
jgi:hypothetical protein